MSIRAWAAVATVLTVSEVKTSYWIGAGDAESDRTIFEFHKWLANANESILRETLESGKSLTFLLDGKKMTQTDYFLLLANLIT